MKSSVAVALIISGTLLILAPYVSNAYGTSQVAIIMAQLHKDASINGNMPGWYDGACFVAGIAMILVAVFASLRRAAE